MASPVVLLLPGWQNSGPAHWQSRWEQRYGDLRVEQHDWMRALRGDWISRLEEVVLEQSAPCVLVAHSLGCMLTAAWAAVSRNKHKVQGALLVGPGDPEREALRTVLPSWSPVVLRPLPFPSTLVGSRDDPYCDIARAQAFARAWGSTWVDYGARGHLNADSGLGDWPEGRVFVDSLLAGCSTPPAQP
jgi:hypothetical protein